MSLTLETFAKAFVANLVCSGLESLDVKTPETTRAFHRVLAAIKKKANHLSGPADRARRVELRRLIAKLDPGAVPSFEEWISSLSGSGFAGAFNPDHNSIYFKITAPFANRFLSSSLSEDDRRLMNDLMAAFMDSELTSS